MKSRWLLMLTVAFALAAFVGCSRSVTHNTTVVKNDLPPTVGPEVINPGQVQASQEMLETGKRKWRVGQIKQARKSFAKAVEKNPYNFEAHYWLAMAERDGRNWDQASVHFAKAVQYAPQGRWEARIRVDWGLSLEEQGQKGPAAKQYDLALLADPDYKEAQVSRRRVLPLPNASTQN
jgi:Tfp pilus assembly protein PilF